MVVVTRHNHIILPKGIRPLDSPARFGAALLTRPRKGRRKERQKGMNTKRADTGAGFSPARQWLTLRVSQEEKKRAEEQATSAGHSVSEYMHRRVFGGRPVVALTDEAMLRELRRVGGLLKHNFETVRQTGMEAGRRWKTPCASSCALLSESGQRTGRCIRAIYA